MWAVDFRMTTRGIVAAGPSYFVGAQANQCAVYAGTLGAVTGRPSGANVSILTTPALSSPRLRPMSPDRSSARRPSPWACPMAT
ncbi:hypothetical protein SNK04_014001 [Fusarium graminearum]